ncbi:hypothetical protein [Photobacterium kishitanii]|uniref:DUF11 domain-containing protein n=1 Tax=Photobacterium kishitanii TaxID=318456 RepID=A0AAX0YS32_9GAMM|nr:hypothetical protein [Photobacterium kishitanii]OBU33690.1 hypothetical protein AYY23_14295 [Photobacterium kishitanii]PSU19297.1 hypothetical protein CTM84_17145 [Photobacterium kishitanii]PSV06469.1 hypothetical protein C0W96_08375 [Photobacterium kishitanii]PSV77352.1 hypothetical protein C0W29_02375 [Photobacterium kishitanii]PSW49637.1 hypothetical protein C0W66_08020 [Photobacterium kishitanii]
MLVFIRKFLFFISIISISYCSYSSGITFTETVKNVTQGGEVSTLIEARPGDVIEYNIDVLNSSESVISNIHISTSVPQFTALATIITCDDHHLPSALRCQVITSDGINQLGYQGTIAWQLFGKLDVGSRARVSYQVIIK